MSFFELLVFYGSLKSFQGGHFVWFMCSVGADLTEVGHCLLASNVQSKRWHLSSGLHTQRS